MAKRPTPDAVAAGLTAPERVLLFCIGTGTDWQKFVPHATAQQIMIRGLIERAGSGFSLTEGGRAVLEVLMMRLATCGRPE
jgi:hypothetical protein